MLTFVEETHKYFWNGERVPSVSEFLGKSGLKPETSFYAPGSAERGTQVHLLTELYDKELLDLDDMKDDELYPYVKAWADFRNDTGFRPAQIEARLANLHYWIAGTVDRIGYIEEREVKIDLKSGMKADWHRYQLATYNLIRDSRAERINVYLDKKGKYKVQPWTDDGDYLRVIAELEKFRGAA